MLMIFFRIFTLAGYLPANLTDIIRALFVPVAQLDRATAS